MLRSLALAALAVAVLVPPASAATTYYATPLTSNTTTCNQANPCTLVGALAKAVSGDTVQLAPGEYHHAGGSGKWINVPGNTTLEGQPGADRPRILQEDPYTNCACAILDSNGHTTFRHLFVDQTADPSGAGALNVTTGDVVEDSLLIGANQGGYSTSIGVGHVDIRNSVLIGGYAGFNVSYNTHFEHVTMVGTRSDGNGLTVTSGSSEPVQATVDNSIADGGPSGHDLVVQTTAPSAAIVVVGHYSDMARSAGDSGGTGTEQIDLSDHVLAAEPDFNPGGFGVTGASPTVDAASAALTSVPFDFAGLPRILGPAPDMGAFEYTPAPDVQASAATAVTQTTAALSGTVTSILAGNAHFEYGTDTSYGSTAGALLFPGSTDPAAIAATLEGLAPNTTYHYRLVAQNDHGTTRTPDASFTTNPAPSPPGDTTAPRISKVKIHWPRIKFALDEPATVTFTIGKRHWTRKLKAGTFTVKAPAKVRRAVKRGRHTLRVVATDDAGNRATVLRKRFRR